MFIKIAIVNKHGEYFVSSKKIHDFHFFLKCIYFVTLYFFVINQNEYFCYNELHII